MTFTNLMGEREALTIKSEDYKHKVIKYMEARDYHLTGNSSIDGSLADLKFKRPLADGPKETHIETKNCELSLFDKQFLNELVDHFFRYIGLPELKRFFLFIFIYKCKSQDRWKKVFDLFENEAIKELKEKIKNVVDNEKLNKFNTFSDEDFLNFITDCHVTQADNKSLEEKIDNLNNSKDFILDKQLLDEKENLLNQEEVITTNILKIISFPDNIWIAPSKKILDMKQFWKENRSELIYPTRSYIISLNPLKNNKYVIKDSIKKEKFQIWMDFNNMERINVIKYLIKEYIIQKGRIMGMRFSKKLNCLYYPHLNKLEKKNRVNKRLVSKIYFKKDGTINFIEHFGVIIDIALFDNSFYLILDHIRLFTEDGEKIIEGIQAKNLHYKFPERYAFNNSEKSKFLFWKGLFQFENKTLANQDFFSFSSPIEIKSPISSSGGENYSNYDSLINYLDGEIENEF